MAIERDAFHPGRASDVESRPKRNLTEAEFHVRATGFALAHFLGILEQIVQAPAYLNDYRRTTARAKRGVNRATETIYHLESFLLRTSTLRDRALHLCSAVCHLGLTGRAVNISAVTTNSVVRSTGLLTSLQRLQKLCEPYARTRNAVAHEHELLDSEIRSAEALILGARAARGSQRASMLAAYRFLIQQFAARKSGEIDEFAVESVAFAQDFLERLDAQFQLRQRQLLVANA